MALDRPWIQAATLHGPTLHGATVSVNNVGCKTPGTIGRLIEESPGTLVHPGHQTEDHSRTWIGGAAMACKEVSRVDVILALK